MEPPGGRDSRFNLGYSMNLLSGETAPEIYGNPNLGRPSTSLQQLSPRHTMVSSACGNRGIKSDMYDERGMSSQGMGLEACGVNDISEDTYSSMQSKKSPPSNGKKTKGRVKIKMEYIENKLRRYTTFSKRKTGIMKKAYELSTLTGTQVMLLVASETGHVYTFATRKLQPMITSEAGKALIQTCLNSPDPPAGAAGGDQRMSATGFEETELTYNISDDDSKEGDDSGSSSSSEDDISDLPEELYTSPTLNRFPPTPKDKLLRKEPDKSTITDLKGPKSNVEINNQQPKSEEKESPMAVTSTSSTAKEHVTSSTPTSNATVPMLLQSSASSFSSPFAVSPQSLPLNTSNTLQAMPLLLQTSAGIGYASTPEGMILGLIQGPNVVQPQLVAIPMSSVAALTQNMTKKDDKQSS